MLSVGRCSVARLQMKFGYMDGMHCITDGTSILVKIKSVTLYNCQAVYYDSNTSIKPLGIVQITSHLQIPDDTGRTDTINTGIQAMKWLACWHKGLKQH